MNDNSKLAVAALQNGTVIDHIPSHLVFKVVRLLDLENVEEASQSAITSTARNSAKRHLESVGRDFS